MATRILFLIVMFFSNALFSSAPVEQKVRVEDAVAPNVGVDEETRDVLQRVTAANMAGFSPQTLKAIDKNKARIKAFENTPFAANPFWKLESRDKKRALFHATMAHDNTAALYYAMQDPEMRKYALEKKVFAELCKTKDTNDRTVLMHAVEQEDASLITQMVTVPEKDFSPDKIATIAAEVGFAFQKNKPKSILALMGKLPGETYEIGLAALLYRSTYLSTETIDTYYATRQFIANNKKHFAQYAQKVLEIGQPNKKDKKEKIESLPKVLQRHIHSMIAPADQAQQDNPNRMDPRLKEAIENGKLDQVTHLLNNGCSLDRQTENGHDALELAALHSHTEVLKKIVEKSKYINPIKQKKLLKLAQKQQRTAQANEAKIKMEQLKELIEYIENGIPEHVRQKNAALFAALGARHMGEMLFALETGANPQVKTHGGTPITNIALFAPFLDPAYLKLLLANGADPNARVNVNGHYVSLLYATSMSALPFINKKKQVELLLDYGADIHAMDSNLWNLAFHEVHELLLSRGATISRKDLNTILIQHMGLGTSEKSFKALLRFRNRAATNDEQVLQRSFEHDPHYLASLLNHGFDPNIKEEDGNPIIFRALRLGTVKHVELLLEAGADVNSKNKKGSTLLDLAYLLNSKERMDLLKQYGAQYSQFFSPNACKLMKMGAVAATAGLSGIIYNWAAPDLSPYGGMAISLALSLYQGLLIKRDY